MVLIFPYWRAHNIEDWESLLVKGDTGREPNACTQALINMLYMAGVTGISEANINEVWLRITLVQGVAGCFVNAADGSPIFLTMNDVKRHIGVEVEGEDRTFEEFGRALRKLAQLSREESLPTLIANGGKSGLARIGLGS